MPCNCNNNGNNRGCCSNNNEKEELETLTITLEDNTELECNILGYFEVDKIKYIALLPLEDEEVLIYRYVEDGEEIILDSIESDEEFEKVSEKFNDLFSEE